MRYIDFHTHTVAKTEKVLRICNCYPSDAVKDLEAFSVGIHPWYIHEDWETQLALLKEKAQGENCYAIGECGLDKLTDTDFELQEVLFRKQVAISEAIQKPLIIHCVKAFQEIYNLKKELQPTQTWVLHGFVKSEQLANQMLSIGCKLSFGNTLLENLKLQRTFAKLNVTDFVLETDTTEVAIEEIYKKAAILQKLGVSSMQQQIEHNCKEIFKR
ncbi:TatD DNase family protein [Pustulibacterium marinum]|uniref:TatD DNase family protein n=1 Tax=Pustulibacterium marinum TaxID=1224947 RepID=A0A1I7GMT4_9FLAO|nr:TatD family hydrolase [Pustulibacterium marinum]SFU49812.1 TatD DNase family protein [Pustulibacterium marinum]